MQATFPLPYGVKHTMYCSTCELFGTIKIASSYLLNLLSCNREKKSYFHLRA